MVGEFISVGVLRFKSFRGFDVGNLWQSCAKTNVTTNFRFT